MEQEEGEGKVMSSQTLTPESLRQRPPGTTITIVSVVVETTLVVSGTGGGFASGAQLSDDGTRTTQTPTNTTDTPLRSASALKGVTRSKSYVATSIMILFLSVSQYLFDYF
ncbi:hypothetical protein PM082_019409 [Marasmius tenuissimus]|nr:hypothetical protein PM082_019409 [Marasmius tenuissimus]